MYKNWPFFQSLLSNVDMVLSKANMDIAFEYAQLCEEEEVPISIRLSYMNGN